MQTAEIQFDLFAPSALAHQNVMALMRPHRWAHAPVGEMELAAIAVEPHEGRWMWSVSINSSNNAAQSYRPLPKWGNFAGSRAEAIFNAADEMRCILHRLTPCEQIRVTEWLGSILSAAQYH
jgi:hypothetical protein